MNQKITRKTKKRINYRLINILIIISLIISLIIMFLNFVKKDIKQSKDIKYAFYNPSAPKQSQSSTQSTVDSSQPEKQTSSEPEKTKPEDIYKDYEYSTVVKKTPIAVERNYFDDAVFIGDSTSIYFKNFAILPPANVIAEMGAQLNNIANGKESYTTVGGKKITLFEALDSLKFKPKKVYILLGMNTIPWIGNDDHIAYYEKVVDKIAAKYPDATIYLQSVTPIATRVEKKEFSNAKINDFNDKINKLAEKKGIYYLNIKEVLVDKNGALKEELVAGKDGFHFLKAGHEIIAKYYREHTVPPKPTKEGE